MKVAVDAASPRGGMLDDIAGIAADEDEEDEEEDDDNDDSKDSDSTEGNGLD